jgi:hypothetical protein
MVRNYQPRNPFDPKSKLALGKTLGIIHYLLAGRPSAWIAEKESVSKNTVSALSARFRRKLRTSAPVRQSCFEPFYVHGFLLRDTYVHFLDGPDTMLPEYFTDLANCVFHCPAQFQINTADYGRTLFALGGRQLNLRQSQNILTFICGDSDRLVRTPCQGCRIMKEGPVRSMEFCVLFNMYLRQRNLRKEHIEEYYLLFAITFLLNLAAMAACGIGWTPDESQLPGEAEWEQLPQRYAKEMNTILYSYIEYMSGFLKDDPLS